ncbi:MAG: MlaD family protein [Solirubrobacteraceae bacterium]|nr:MlaD family protein [Solirubrobacteraceae bacterium]
MIRRVTILAVVVAGLLASGCGGDGGAVVRVTFLDAHGVAPGAPVAVDGRDVGAVAAVDLDARARAVVHVRLPERVAARFRRDATCTVTTADDRRLVACRPSASGDGADRPSPLAVRREGALRVRSVPVERTAGLVDRALLDAVRDRDPAERLGVVVRDLGVGLADAGPDLRRAVRAAVPGLRDADRVVRALDAATADLDRTAARARSGLRALTAERARIGRAVRRGADLQRTIAARAPEVDRTLRAAPGALRALRPALAGLRDLTDAATPTVDALTALVPTVDAARRDVERTARVGAGPLRAVGDTAAAARRTILRARPVLARVGAAAAEAAPVLRAARELGRGLERRGAVRSGLDAIVELVLAVNAYDDVGHRLRIRADVDACGAPAHRPVAGCATGLTTAAAGRAADGPRAAGEPRRDALLRRTLAGGRPGRELARAADDPALRPLLRRLADLRDVRRRGATSGRTPARGGDAPITLDGGLLPRPEADR